MKCEVCDCAVEPTFHFTGIDSRRVVFEKYFCDAHARTFLMEFRSTVSMGSGTKVMMPAAVPVEFEMVVYHNAREDNPACIYLHEVGGERRFGVMASAWAWWALMVQIKEERAASPHTHVGWSATIRELGGRLQDVVVDRTDDSEGRWSAKLRIVKEGRLATVDVRASDAYILAVIHDVPIFVVETALEKFADRGEGTRTN